MEWENANKVQRTSKSRSLCRRHREFSYRRVPPTPSSHFPSLTWWGKQQQVISCLYPHRAPMGYHSTTGATPGSPELQGHSPLTRNPHLPGLVWGASGVVVVLSLGRGRRVRFDVLGAEERKPSVTSEFVVQQLWVAKHTSSDFLQLTRFPHILGSASFKLFNLKLSPLL